MSDKHPFDTKIADALRDMEAPYEPATWEQLRQKMEAPTPDSSGAPFSDFDQTIKAALEGMEAPFQRTHWDKMAQRLAQQATIRRVRIHKAAEAALIILLVANFDAFIHGGARLFHMPVPAEPAAQETPIAQKQRSRRAPNGQPATIGAAIQLPENALPGADSSTQYAKMPAIVLTDENRAQNTPAISEPLTINQAILGPDGRPVPHGLRPLTLLAALGLPPVSTPPMAAVMPSVKTLVAAPKARKRHKTYLLAHGGYAQHRVKGENAYQTGFNAANAGLAAAVRKGKWGVEAGLQYAQHQYQTDTEVFDFYKKDDKTYGISYDQVQAEVMSVPVRASRQIAQWGKNSVQVLAGAAAHIAVAKDHTYQHTPYPSLPQGQPLHSQPVLPVAQGAMEGGAMRDNYFASVDAALRYERIIAPRMIAYVEPHLRRQAGGNGYGPQKQRIHSVGVQAGIMAAL